MESPLREKFISDFEVGMEDFYRRRNTDTTAFLREMAAYFAQFEPGPGNHYAGLARIAAEARGRVVFATTNYDLLLELAIDKAGYAFAYELPRLYDRGGIPLLKIHGSCNFLPHQGGLHFENMSFDLNVQEKDDTPIEELNLGIYDSPVSPATPAATRHFCRVNDSMAPAIGLYLPGKHTLWCGSFVKRQQEMWREAVQRAGRIYIIGAAIYDHDTHIWDVLANAKAQLRYVDPHPERFLEWCERHRRKGASPIEGYFAEALPRIRRQMKDR